VDVICSGETVQAAEDLVIEKVRLLGRLRETLAAATSAP
jgi:hypothetical protein